MTYLAAITEWLRAWGPVVWGGIGICAALVIWLLLFLASFLRATSLARTARANLEATLTHPRGKVSPLEHSFENKIINPSDLYVPYAAILTGKQFRDCHIVGPGLIGFGDRVTFRDSDFVDTPVFVLGPNSRVTGLPILNDAFFERCKIVETIVVAGVASALSIKQQLKMPDHTFLGYPIGQGAPQCLKETGLVTGREA